MEFRLAVGSEVGGQFHTAVMAENPRLVAGAATAISSYHGCYSGDFFAAVRSTFPTSAVASTLACTSHIIYISIIPGPRFRV